MLVYYCKVCGKVVGEAQQGKKGIRKIAIECYSCVRSCFTKREMLEVFKEEQLKGIEFIHELGGIN